MLRQSTSLEMSDGKPLALFLLLVLVLVGAFSGAPVAYALFPTARAQRAPITENYVHTPPPLSSDVLQVIQQAAQAAQVRTKVLVHPPPQNFVTSEY